MIMYTHSVRTGSGSRLFFFSPRAWPMAPIVYFLESSVPTVATAVGGATTLFLPYRVSLWTIAVERFNGTGFGSPRRARLHGCVVAHSLAPLSLLASLPIASNLGIPEAGPGSLKSRRVGMASSAPLLCGRRQYVTREIPDAIRRRGYRTFPCSSASQGPSALPSFRASETEAIPRRQCAWRAEGAHIQSGLAKTISYILQMYTSTVTCILYTALSQSTG